MALEVQIEKKFPGFTLQAEFTAGNAPLSILGPSGAGKSMLLRCIAGILRPDSGRIALDGQVFFDSTRGIRMPARERGLGLLFQHYALFPHRTVTENIGFGLRHLSHAGRATRIKDLVQRTHIPGLEQRFPHELSGGEQQRVALARALAIEPKALLLDEPLSALDTHLRSQVEALLQETFASYRRPTLLVTHNIEEAYRLGEQLLVLSRGRIAAMGGKEEIFRNPTTREVAQLTGCKNFSRVRMISENVVEALDWGCRLQVSHSISRPPSWVGIRAHHIGFPEASSAASSQENIFPCWLVRYSETPFRMTLYLRLNTKSANPSEFDLQAEVFKEKWNTFRDRPQPWHVRLSPDSLFLMPE